MSGSDALHLDHQLCFALHAASRAMVRAYAPLLAPLGVTYPQYLVLLVLWEDGGSSVSELGDRLSLDSGTLTPLLKRMELLGLVTRRRSEEDERVVRVELTARGRTLRAKATGIPERIACKAGFDVASPTSMKTLVGLREALAALSAQLEGRKPVPPAGRSR